ncbi:GSPII E domain/HD domain/response regulator [Minicystis rosea]|nr:GSPII E domain/HD domain/response regulator [Minicystis rosea]
MSNGRFSGINQRIADRLLAEGRLTREDHQRVVEYATRQKGRIEEALIELEVMSEADLLKFIATVHNTRFVSGDKLSKAVIEPRLLARVPVRTADLHGVFPVLFDDKASVLSVVTADPDNDAALHEVRLAAGVKEVRALAARPAAVRAAIQYHYRNDRGAFSVLSRPVGFLEMLHAGDPFDRRSTQTQSQPGGTPTQKQPTPPSSPTQSWTQSHTPLAPPPQPPQAGWGPQQQPWGGPFQQAATQFPMGAPQQNPFGMGPPQGGFGMGPQQGAFGMGPQQPGWGPQQQPGQWTQQPQGWAQGPQGGFGGPAPAMQQPQMQQPQMQSPQMQSPQMQQPQMQPPQQMQQPQQMQSPPPPAPQSPPPREAPAPAQPARSRSHTPTKIDQFLAPPQPAAQPPAPARSPSTSSQSSANAKAALPASASPQYIETLNVLVSLLESSRADLRGHSATVARLTRKTCERIGLSPLQTAAFTAAGYLHDLGKMGAYHLTALNVAEYEGHRIAAGKSGDLPVHLMESVGLLPETLQAIASMYERYDGQGIPDGQAGKDIPLGARILAVADTYADLTQNPRNPYRKILRPFEACEVLLQYRSTVFDPNIVDIFRQSTTGEDMRAKLLSDRHEALIVDPDPEETTVLELRLIEQGFEVKIARTAAQARKLLGENEIDAVISEIDLDTPDGGLALRDALLKEGAARDVTWVMLTSKTDRQAAQRAFDLGVDDFVMKPVSADIFAAKLRQLIERRASKEGGGGARGVTGSLTEMSLPDMIQILWHGRKTCALRITSGPSSGEIDFAEGQVVDARWDALRGEDAFYKLLTLREGDFRLDPTFKPTTRTIEASPEALLLEGMRRLDEGST